MQRVIVSAWALPVMVLICGGCSDRSAPPLENVKNATIQPLAAFPTTRRMMLGEFQAQIKPLISIPVAAAVDGDIRFCVSDTRTLLERDVLWATIGAEQIASEEHELELKTAAEKLRLREDLMAVERELAQVEYILKEPALRDLPFQDDVPVSSNLVLQLRGERRLLEEQLAVCGEADRLSLQQKNLRSRLVMPFDGELQIYLPVSSERKTFRVSVNTPIGIMRDLSELYLHVVIRDPQLVGIPPERLFVEYRRESGALFGGRFHDIQVAELQGQEVLIYRFAFGPEQADELGSLIGANLTCELWVQADREFHTVPKIELARYLDEKSAFSGWGQAIQALWPASRVLYEGRSHLGVVMEGGAE